MLDVMFDVPSRSDVDSCLITEQSVKEKLPPELTLREETPAKKEESA
jgi:ATP-dependent Clp protease ATP-binding subunit ClpX